MTPGRPEPTSAPLRAQSEVSSPEDGTAAISHLDPEARFLDYLQAFRREGQRLVMLMAVYRFLHEQRHDNLDALNVAPAFFQTVLIALREAIILTAHKMVVGGRGDEVSLGTFLNFVSANLGLFSTEAFRTRRKLKENAWQIRRHQAPTPEAVRGDRRRLTRLTVVQSLKILRDKYHAHFDRDFFFEPARLGESAPLRWQDLMEIGSTVEEILNRYSAAFDGNVLAFEPMNALDVEHVIDALRAWHNRPSRRARSGSRPASRPATARERRRGRKEEGGRR